MSSIEERLNLLERLYASHLGQQQALGTSLLPHGNMHVDVTYTITNGTTDRTYDADASSTNELADILYTLIQDLKLLGLVG